MFILAVMLLALALSFSTAGAADGYLQTNLVSDIPRLWPNIPTQV